MTGTMNIRIAFGRVLAVLAAIAVCATLAQAQAGRVVGTITAIDGSTLTVKTDAGEQKQVTVPSEATLKRLEPGQKDLNAAAAIQISDLAVGDRVLIKLDPSASTPQASLLVAMKKADVAQAHEKDSEAWQRGVAGLVKTVAPASGTIVVTAGAGPTAKAITVKTTSSTRLLRYSPESARFADAKPAPMDAVKPGDQLRARGTKNADATEIAADAIVSGTFRHIAGTVTSVDADASTVAVKDLATKKQITIHVPSDVQLRRIPENMAQMLAARLKGNGPGTSAAGGARGANGAPHSGAPSEDHAAGSGAPAPGGGNAHAGGPGGQGGGNNGDPQHMLSMAPVIKLSDLQKGQAVMVVTTEGASDVNAITLLAGVEPLLEAPAATDLLSNWSMGGGGADAAGGNQ